MRSVPIVSDNAHRTFMRYFCFFVYVKRIGAGGSGGRERGREEEAVLRHSAEKCYLPRGNLKSPLLELAYAGSRMTESPNHSRVFVLFFKMDLSVLDYFLVGAW